MAIRIRRQDEDLEAVKTYDEDQEDLKILYDTIQSVTSWGALGAVGLTNKRVFRYEEKRKGSRYLPLTLP